jgi:hypothetical protein
MSVRHEDAACWSRLLQAGGDVDCIPCGEALPRRGIADHNLASVDARAVSERYAPAAFEFCVELLEGCSHLARGAYCSEGVILVGARETEDRHDGVADVFLDDAAVAFYDGAHLGEVAVHDLP